jgi:hypothetical protein
MPTGPCPKCGTEIPTGNAFCPNCSMLLTQLPPTPQTVTPQNKINTYTAGWIIIALFVSLLWFKFNGKLVFPLGFVVALVISAFSWHIDKQVGKPSFAPLGFVFSFIGMILGAAINST